MRESRFRIPELKAEIEEQKEKRYNLIIGIEVVMMAYKEERVSNTKDLEDRIEEMESNKRRLIRDIENVIKAHSGV